MNRNVAEQLMADAMKCYEALESAELIAKKIEETEEQVAVTKSILLTASELEEGLMSKIVSQHPDLNPFSEERPRTF